jgi:hypothetical protein
MEQQHSNNTEALWMVASGERHTWGCEEKAVHEGRQPIGQRARRERGPYG